MYCFQTIYNIGNLTAGFDVNFTTPDSPDRIHNCYTSSGDIELRCLEHYAYPTIDHPHIPVIDWPIVSKAVFALADAKFLQLFNIKGIKPSAEKNNRGTCNLKWPCIFYLE